MSANVNDVMLRQAAMTTEEERYIRVRIWRHREITKGYHDSMYNQPKETQTRRWGASVWTTCSSFIKRDVNLKGLV